MSESQIDYSGYDSVDGQDLSGADRSARARRRTSSFHPEYFARQRFLSGGGPRYFGTGMAGFTSVPWIGM